MKRSLIPLALILFFLVSSLPVNQADSAPLIMTDQAMLAEASPIRVYGEDLSRAIWGFTSQDSYFNYVKTISENGSRWIMDPSSMSDQNVEAREYIIEELHRVSNGRIETEVIGDYHSIVGKLPGYLPIDAPGVLIGGHYDSVPGAPGANDDGTGIATVLELARVMSMYEWPLDIYFGAWNAEEIGLIGSGEVATEFHNRGIELIVHYNIDMLLVSDPMNPTFLMAYPVGYYQEGRYWAELTQMMSMNYGSNVSVPIMSSDFGSSWQRSDHWPFIQRGYGSSLFAFESGFWRDTAYHTGADNWQNEMYDYTLATEAVRSIGSSIAFMMSWAYKRLATFDSTITLQPSHSKTYYFAISTETEFNVDCRWWGGVTSMTLRDPSGILKGTFYAGSSFPWEQANVLSVNLTAQGIYQLDVFNHGGTTTGQDITVTYDQDINNNDILDSQEFWFDVSLFESDQDGDTISDADEMILGTSMTSQDSDQDNVPDPWELEYDMDPLDSSDGALDFDSDGLTNAEEYEYGCNPRLADSDADSMPDLFEVENGLNPLVNDADQDLDNDLVTNLQEYLDGTDPAFAELRLERYVAPVSVVAVAAIVLTGAVLTKKRHI